MLKGILGFESLSLRKNLGTPSQDFFLFDISNLKT
jgi:hypothetical protein